MTNLTDYCFATSTALSGPSPKYCADLRCNQSLRWSFGSGVDRSLQLVTWAHIVSLEEQHYLWRRWLHSYAAPFCDVLHVSLLCTEIILHLCAGKKLKAWMDCIHPYLLSRFYCYWVMCRPHNVNKIKFGSGVLPRLSWSCTLPSACTVYCLYPLSFHSFSSSSESFSLWVGNQGDGRAI